MLYGTGTCNLLTMLRSAVYDSNQCQYYLKKSTNVDIENRQLSDIDKLVQNAVYNSQGECPDGWDSEVTICTLDIEEDVCNEYASFLETSYDFVCTVNLMSVNYTCPNESFTLGSFSNGHYCYIFVPKYDESENPNNLTYYEKSNQYCKETTGSYLASIHSEDENTLINKIQNETSDGNVGTIIGLVSSSSPVASADDMYWLDGTDVDYVNYVGDDPTSNNPFYLTMMTPNARWNTGMLPHVVVMKFKFIASIMNISFLFLLVLLAIICSIASAFDTPTDGIKRVGSVRPGSRGWFQIPANARSSRS
uniref:C-type lectin domain-containing protein n=1 Tax=Panagrellus redivivus TaxID=6233 RepID=A0A7E4UT54_PANRE